MVTIAVATIAIIGINKFLNQWYNNGKTGKTSKTSKTMVKQW